MLKIQAIYYLAYKPHLQLDLNFKYTCSHRFRYIPPKPHLRAGYIRCGLGIRFTNGVYTLNIFKKLFRKKNVL